MPPTLPNLSAKRALDALDLELFRASTTSVVDEIEVNLSRTAYSPLVYEYKDYCVAWLTRDCLLLTQSRGSLPIFLSDLGPPVKDAVDTIGKSRMRPGDVFLTNFAAVAGQHLNNVVTARPVFEAGDLAGYIAIRAHWADLGGLVPGSISWDARDIYQEGIQFRGLRVVRDDELEREVVATIQANTRMPEYVLGDLMAQIAGCRIGERRWRERVLSRWSMEQLQRLTELQWETSEALARHAIRELPDGRYSANASLDDDGLHLHNPLPIRLGVEIAGDEFKVDLSALPPQTVTPMNTGRMGGAMSAVRVAFKSLLAPDQPADEGLFAPLTVDIPDGTMLSAAPDAPMGHWYNALPTVIDLVMRAVGEGAAGRVPAGHHATMGVFMFYGQRPDGSWWQLIDTIPGGWGGSSDSDGGGPFKTMFHGDNRDVPVEVLEARYPLRVEKYSFRPDSAGAGKYRGGFGTEKVLRVVSPAFLETAMDRTLDPPWGLNGGQPGVAGSIDVRLSPDEEWMRATRATRLELPPGAVVRIRSSGGGGWGSPQARHADAVHRDQRGGLVSPDPAIVVPRGGEARVL